MFFVIVAKDQAGVVDWRAVNNVTTVASLPPDNSARQANL
jgi:hypothetical protein